MAAPVSCVSDFTLVQIQTHHPSLFDVNPLNLRIKGLFSSPSLVVVPPSSPPLVYLLSINSPDVLWVCSMCLPPLSPLRLVRSLSLASIFHVSHFLPFCFHMIFVLVVGVVTHPPFLLFLVFRHAAWKRCEHAAVFLTILHFAVFASFALSSSFSLSLSELFKSVPLYFCMSSILFVPSWRSHDVCKHRHVLLKFSWLKCKPHYSGRKAGCLPFLQEPCRQTHRNHHTSS